MFFASILGVPAVVGLAAGYGRASRAVALGLAALGLALGIAGAVAIGLDDDTTERASAVVFSLVAGAVAAGLVVAGWSIGRRLRG